MGIYLDMAAGDHSAENGMVLQSFESAPEA